MNLRLSVSIDDVNPSPQYRILGTPAEKWLTQLHDEFGVKYTLFIPSCYHRHWPISQHKGWINELANDPKFSCEAHGHYHQTTDPIKYGECEFFELNYDDAYSRLELSLREWEKCDIIPTGFRPPGWLISGAARDAIEGIDYSPMKHERIYDFEKWFKYVAIHYEHNNNLKWKCRTFFGHDGIQQENISIHTEDMIMFTSHIAGKHNHNVWNEQNYEQLRMSLTHLFENYTIEPKFLKECL